MRGPTAAEIAARRALGLSDRAIGAEFGLSHETIRQRRVAIENGEFERLRAHGRRRELSAQEKAQIIEAAQGRQTFAAIAARLGVTSTFVRERLLEWGYARGGALASQKALLPKPPRSAVPDECAAEVADRPCLPPMHPLTWAILNAGLVTMQPGWPR